MRQPMELNMLLQICRRSFHAVNVCLEALACILEEWTGPGLSTNRLDEGSAERFRALRGANQATSAVS